MKKLLVSVFMAATVLAAHAADTDAITSTINRIKAEVQAQMERVQRVGEITNAGITLADVRMGEQLRIAQKDLAIQSEKLNILREQLLEVLSQSGQEGPDLNSDWKEQADQALAGIQSQQSRNSDLMDRLTKLQETADAGLGCPFTAGKSRTVRMVWNSYGAGTGPLIVKPPEYYSGDSLLETLAEIAPPNFTDKRGDSKLPMPGSPVSSSIGAATETSGN
jgi:hypothetical protein